MPTKEGQREGEGSLLGWLADKGEVAVAKITAAFTVVVVLAATVLGVVSAAPAVAAPMGQLGSKGSPIEPSDPSATASATPNLAGRPHTRVCSAPRPDRAACLAEVVDGVASPSTPAGFGPADLRSAYNLTTATTAGTGATVAVVDAYDLPTADADLATYRAKFGLPACTAATGCFRKVDQRGGSSYPPARAGWGAEIALDLEMVSAVCPNCRIILVEADDDYLTSLGAAVQTAVSLGAKYVTNSYGSDSPSDFSSFDRFYDHPGVVVTAASGDAGYGTQFPASSRYVTAVGGTSLSRAANPRGWTESAWSGAGSGCSGYSPAPAWQTGTGCASKAVADVSAVADPNTGVAVYAPPLAGGASVWQVFGGTSASSPLIAGMYALAGAPAPSTYPASYPWGNQSGLNDVTAGSNGSGCSPAQLCAAGPGYDGPTGLGTPNGVASLASPTTVQPSTAWNDFNSDGASDVLARSTSGTLLLYRGNGAGGWGMSTGVGSGWNGMTAVVSPGDFDGDGHDDILARDSAGQLWLYPGDGVSSWYPRRLVGAGWNGMRQIIAAHDFTGDGKPDILAVDSAGALKLYPGNGHGGWLASSVIGAGWGSMTAIVGITDFDGDNSADLLARDTSGRLLLYAHTTAGWKAPKVVGAGWSGMTAIVSPGDFNGDGHDDILARTSTGALVLYPTTGNSGWGTARQVGTGWNGMNWIG